MSYNILKNLAPTYLFPFHPPPITHIMLYTYTSSSVP